MPRGVGLNTGPEHELSPGYRIEHNYRHYKTLPHQAEYLYTTEAFTHDRGGPATDTHMALPIQH